MADKPLTGRTVVITRPQHQSQEMAEALRNLGAEAVLMPAIEIKAIDDLSPLDRSLANLNDYRWLIFTSANGVRIALDRAQQLGLDWDAFSDIRLATIGPATADTLAEYGLQAEFIPESFVAEEVAAGLPEAEGARILLPRAAKARDVLPINLSQRGAEVDEIHIYHSVQAQVDPQTIERLKSGVDAITFTSPSTARSFTAMIQEAGLNPLALPGQPLVACIGPITARAARSIGYRVDLVAQQYTAEGLVQALLDHYGESTADE